MANQRTIDFYMEAMQMGWMYAIKQTCHGFEKANLIERVKCMKVQALAFSRSADLLPISYGLAKQTYESDGPV